MENYPILNEPGKGRYAIYFRLNERAVQIPENVIIIKEAFVSSTLLYPEPLPPKC